MSTNDAAQVTAHRVPESERLRTLPAHFGRMMMTVENAIYDQLRELAADYGGAYWHFFELSNGGFYMAPDGGPMAIRVDGNGFEGTLSADAAGITACLFAFSHLSFVCSEPTIADHFHLLREFALDHAEASLIFGAID